MRGISFADFGVFCGMDFALGRLKKMKHGKRSGPGAAFFKALCPEGVLFHAAPHKAMLVFCLAGALFVLFSCASTGFEEGVPLLPPREAVVWNAVAPGVEESVIFRESPPLRAWAYRINLGNPNLEVVVTPGLGAGVDSALSSGAASGADSALSAGAGVPGADGSGAFGGRYTAGAAREWKLDLTVNGSPFHPFVFSEGSVQQVTGLSVSGGRVFSSPVEGFAAALFSGSRGEGYRARFGMPPFCLDEVDEAVGGFYLVLENGVPSGKAALGGAGPGGRNPLTLLGRSSDGCVLYVLVVDGRQPRWSRGLTLREAALWLLWLGAREGMNLDGGGSTTLVRRFGEHYRVINRPVDLGIPGKQRVVPNHLGFRFFM